MSKYDQSQSLDATQAKEIHRVIPDGVVVINEEQTIVYFNPAAESMFKMKAENVQDRPLDILIPQEVVETHRRYVEAFQKSLIVSGLKKNGIMRWSTSKSFWITSRHKSGI